MTINQRYIYILVAILWGVLVSASLWWNFNLIDKKVLDKATERAEFVTKIIESARLWNAKHGGVYVKIDDKTKPNPYLKIKNRDINSTNGFELTLMNPAYMTRELVGVVKELSGLEIHLTSLKLLNPHNKADEWEEKMLYEFERGSGASAEIFKNNYFRYMQPLKIERACLECHAHQGYKLGENRGGLSVSFSAEALFGLEKAQKKYILFVHIVAWIIFVAFTSLFIYRSRSYLRGVELEKERAKEQVRVQTDHIKKLSYATQFSPASIIITDIDGLIEYVNPKFTEITGYGMDEVLGKKTSILRSGKTEIATYTDLWNTIKNKKEWHGELLNKTKDGREIWESVRISPILDKNQNITNFVAVKEDVTLKRFQQKQIWHQANFDALTDIPNRKYFKELLEDALSKAKLKSKILALLYIDLDGFKPINDTLGHTYGDVLLKELAIRLQKVIRGGDIVARLGGDEFVIVLTSGVSRVGVGMVAQNVLDTISNPFYLLDDDTPSYVSASIGISFSDNLDSKGFIKNADSAMYEAKNSGRGRFVFFEDMG